MVATSMSLLIKIVECQEKLLSTMMKPYLRRFFTYFMKVRPNGIIFCSLLHFSEKIACRQDFRLITYIFEHLKDIIDTWKFKKY